MRHGRSRWGAAFAVCVALVAGGCNESPDAEQSRTAGTSNKVVEVQLRDIHSIVVLQGEVVASPTYTTSVRRAGSFAPGVEDGQRVQAGDVVGSVGGRVVKAPSDGTVVDVARAGEVPGGMPLVSIEYGGFGLVAPVDDSMTSRLYGRKLGAKASLVDGASGFDCTLVDALVAAESAEVGAPAEALCLVPMKFRAFPGMPAHVGIDMGARKGVPALPLSAVVGVTQEGTVALVDGDRTRETQIELGISDGNFVEVAGGLEPGDTVLLNAPLF